jgi:ubiquinone/menaquinone biosynthesis C-methylase UbiE
MSLPKGYLDTEALDIFAKLLIGIKQRSYEAMHIQPHHTLLDLGCGPGTDTIPLAALVGSQGRIIGVDYDLAMLAEANQRAGQLGIQGWVGHQQAEATSLPFEDHYFNACRSDRLFQHLSNPAKALSEMVRVTKPSGWIVIVDTDWGSLSVDSVEEDIERRYARFVASSALHNGYSGRTLYRHFKQQNLTDIRFEVFPVTVTRSSLIRQATQAERTEQEAVDAGILSKEEVQRLRISQTQADDDDIYFATVNLVLLAGRKPVA